MRGSLGFDNDIQEDDMKGSETRLVAYMQGANNRFVIPVYQRNYDWKTENCKQLFDDLIKVVREHRTSSAVLSQFTIPMQKAGITNFWL